MSGGLQEAADVAEKEMEVSRIVRMCNHAEKFSDRSQTGVIPISGNPVLERDDQARRETRIDLEKNYGGKVSSKKHGVSQCRQGCEPFRFPCKPQESTA